MIKPKDHNNWSRSNHLSGQMKNNKWEKRLLDTILIQQDHDDMTRNKTVYIMIIEFSNGFNRRIPTAGNSTSIVIWLKFLLKSFEDWLWKWTENFHLYLQFLFWLRRSTKRMELTWMKIQINLLAGFHWELYPYI